MNSVSPAQTENSPAGGGKNTCHEEPCPNQGCRGGKIHSLVGFDIFWDDCPICGGLGSVKRSFPDKETENHHHR